MKPKVLVVGSSNTDMVVKTERVPDPGETLLGGDFMMISGGKGANQAVAAARLGAEVTLVARVGRDVFGERMAANLTAAGVNTRYIVRDDGAPSGIALVFVAPTGQNAILVAPGANHRLTAGNVDAAADAFERCDVVVLQLEIPDEAVLATIDRAHRLDKPVILNPAPARHLPASAMQKVAVLTPNENETLFYLKEIGESGLEAKVGSHEITPSEAQRLLALGVKSAVVTCGRRGAIVVSDDRAHAIPGHRVTVEDTTAAGDCFTGALTCALAEGKELGPAAHFANFVAALSVTKLGAQTSLPIRAEVDEFIHRRSGIGSGQ